MTPAAGDVPLGEPADGNTAINSIVLTNANFNDQVGQYTLKNGDADGTDYVAGLQAALAILAASSDPSKLLVFASDGLSNEGGLAAFNAAVATLTGTGTVANSIAIGASASCTGGTDGDLQDIAVNGGQCFSVPDPNDLPDLIPDLIGSTLTKVEMTVDRWGADVADDRARDTGRRSGDGDVLDDDGRVGSGDARDLRNRLRHRRHGWERRCRDVRERRCLRPRPHARGSDERAGVGQHARGHGHAERSRWVGRRLPRRLRRRGAERNRNGRLQPGRVHDERCWSRHVHVLGSGCTRQLGVDTITAEVTLNDPTGATDTELVTKEWEDTTPPVVACRPTTNPSGQEHPARRATTPRAARTRTGSTCYLAIDASTRTRDITVSDSGSSFVAGPYASGTKIKLTQAPGASPNVKPGPGAIDWHITLKGDAVVTATDGSGNARASAATFRRRRSSHALRRPTTRRAHPWGTGLLAAPLHRRATGYEKVPSR